MFTFRTSCTPPLSVLCQGFQGTVNLFLAAMRKHVAAYRTLVLGAGTSGCEDKLLRLAQWAWQPTSCTLLPFDASFLSQKMSGKRVLFIGDSTMRQQFWALGLLMKARGMIDVEVPKVTEWTTRHNATFAVQGIQFLIGAQ